MFQLRHLYLKIFVLLLINLKKLIYEKYQKDNWSIDWKLLNMQHQK